jgi:hypothetical protein
MELAVGFEPIAVRQQVLGANQITGILPQLVGPPIVYFDIQAFYKNRYDVGSPAGFLPPTLVADDGGIFRFPTGAVITEVRAICGAGSVLSIYIEEDDGSSSVLVGSGLSGVANRHVMVPEGLPVLPSQQLRILETVSGAPVGVDKSLAVYVVKRGRMP